MLILRRSTWLVTLTATLTFAGTWQGSAQTVPARQAPSASPSNGDPAYSSFREAIERYLALHRRLRNELPALAPNSNARQINETSDALARAIQRARPKAQPGDLFTAETARVIKERVAAVLRDPKHPDLLGGIDDETRAVRAPRMHLR
jgi:hypothetical protein